MKSINNLKTSETYHTPVLLKQTVDLLNIQPGKKYLDATLGGGGHSEEIILRGGMVLGIDQDPEALEFASKRLDHILSACPARQSCAGGKYPPPVFAQGNFGEIDVIAKQNGFDRVDGILFDLGVSAHQFENAGRGFSFNSEADLDMRMNPNLAVTAKDLINGLTEPELSQLFEKYGEEREARKFAKAICLARKVKTIEKCSDLANIIVRKSFSSHKVNRIHPATKIFQALRIAVNDEINNLKVSLPKAVDLLNPGGRLVVISFHSLEDGIVKRFFQDYQEKNIIKKLTEKPISPLKSELDFNPRSRSAKLRGAEKI